MRSSLGPALPDFAGLSACSNVFDILVKGAGRTRVSEFLCEES